MAISISDTKDPSRLPYSPLLHLLVRVILFLSVFLPPSILSSKARRWLFVPLVMISSHLALRTTTGDVMGDLGLGPYIASECALSFDHIVLCDPRKEFRLKRKSESNGDGTEKRNMGHDGGWGNTLWSRFKPSLKLMFTPRLIGWTHEPTRILPSRPKPGTTRAQFIISTILQIVACAVLDTVTYTINSFNPALSSITSLWDHPWKYRVMGVLGYAGNTYARMNISYCLLAIVLVTLRLTDPEEWPRLFGGITEAWCVGRFWSRTWHHILYHTLTSISNTLFPPTNGFLNLFLRTNAAFFFSGLIHTAGERMMAGEYSACSQLFFMVQPLAIGIERLVLARLGVFDEIRKGRMPSIKIRLIGYMWVLTWFSITVPIVMAPIVKVGVFEHRMENGGLGVFLVQWLRDRKD